MTNSNKRYDEIIEISDFISDEVKNVCGFTVIFKDLHVENFFLSRENNGRYNNLNQLKLRYNEIENHLNNQKKNEKVEKI